MIAPPNRKVNAAALAGALSVVIIWAVKVLGHTEIPAEVASAVTTVLSFLTGYVVAEPE